MSGFDPIFDSAGTGSRAGPVPAPGSIDGRTFYLRADGSWAVPVGNTPGPEPPTDPTELSQWACNIAGYLTYEVCRIAVKLAVDWVPVSWIGDIVGGITAGVVRLVLAEDPIVAAIISDMVFHFVQDHIVGMVSGALTNLLDDVLWAKVHCALYTAIAAAPTDFAAALTAAAGVIGAFAGYTAAATAAIAYFLQHLGITSVANIPLSAFIQNYDCSTCAVTGIGPTKPLLQSSFDLTVTDDTNTRTFVDEIEFLHATISGTAPHAVHTPNTTTSSALGINKPDNTTITVDGSGVYSVVATPSTSTFYSTVGVGKKFQLGSEPAGWQNVGFDDSAWTAPVLETGGGPTPEISGAARITSTDGAVSTSAVFLFRLAFTLPPGAVLSAISTILEDNISTVWINGTEISTYTRPPTDHSDPHATAFDVSLLATNNVLAIKIENGAFGFGSNPMSVEYKLAIAQAASGELTVEHGGSVVGSRRAINLTDGGGITWTVADDASDARVNISAAGTGFANPMTTAADLVVGGTAGAATRLAKGSDGQVLTVDPSTHLLVWATPGASGMANPMTTKGDLIAAAAAGVANRLGVGADNTFLRALASATLGVMWDTLADSDIPNLPASKITSGQLSAARGGTGIDSSGFALGSVLLNTGSAWGGLAPLADNLVLTSSAAAPGGAIWSSGGSGGGTNNYVLLADGLVSGSVAASVTLAVAAGFNHLILKWVARSDNAAEQELRVQFNTDTAGNYEFTEMSQTGNASSSGVTGGRFGVLPASGLTAGKAASGTFSLPFHSGTTWHKVLTYESWRASLGTIENGSAIWHSTAAITQLKVYSNTGNLSIGSRFMLYGSV